MSTIIDIILSLSPAMVRALVNAPMMVSRYYLSPDNSTRTILALSKRGLVETSGFLSDLGCKVKAQIETDYRAANQPDATPCPNLGTREEGPRYPAQCHRPTVRGALCRCRFHTTGGPSLDSCGPEVYSMTLAPEVQARLSAENVHMMMAMHQIM